jgi:hypothetical protein
MASFLERGTVDRRQLGRRGALAIDRTAHSRFPSRPRDGRGAVTRLTWRARLAIGLLVPLLVPAAAVAAPGISGADGDVWNAASPTPTYAITSDGRPRVEWRLDGGRWVREREAAVVLAFRPIADGEHVLLVRGDRSGPGGGGDAEATRRFRVDTAPPRISILEPRAGTLYAHGQAVAARYSCSGAESCAGPVRDGEPLATGAPGPASFVVRAVDDAGNAATARVDYAVAPPAPAPAAPRSEQVAPLATAPSLPALASPRPRRAHLLSPRAGSRVTTARPLLRWRPHPRARLYNVQLYLLEGGAARKVLSAFPAGPRLRVPAARLAVGRRYLWRVWPYVAGRYPRQPIGLSFFDVARPRA